MQTKDHSRLISFDEQSFRHLHRSKSDSVEYIDHEIQNKVDIGNAKVWKLYNIR